MVQTFEQFLETHKDEIEVLQILYSMPYTAGLSLGEQIRRHLLVVCYIDCRISLHPDLNIILCNLGPFSGTSIR